MSEESSAPTGVQCCPNSDAASVKPCQLCQGPVCDNCRVIVNGKRVCGVCQEQIVTELKKERADSSALPMSIGAGVVSAVVCGAVWAAITVVTNMEIGWVAIGVGWLTGQAVVLGARGKKGRQLQMIAAGCSLLGLVLGKYFIVAHVIKTQLGVNISYFDVKIIQFFFGNLGLFLQPFDALWAIFALLAAWSVPKPIQLDVR
jgi:hypothetical protein